MVDENQPDSLTMYRYDAAGNLLSAVVKGASLQVLFKATYNGRNQIATADGVSYQYNAVGELINDSRHTYTWDAAHRLVSVHYNLAFSTTHYSYDGLGRRVTIATPSSVTYYLWCGWQQCARTKEEAQAGQQTQFFAQGELQGNTALFYARDRLGSITDLVDATDGSLAASYRYDPWGNITST